MTDCLWDPSRIVSIIKKGGLWFMPASLPAIKRLWVIRGVFQATTLIIWFMSAPGIFT